jgi:hypothetical protein
MARYRLAVLVSLLISSQGTVPIALAQTRGNPAALIASQRDAMATLGFVDGIWRGTAWTIPPSGEKHSITQTEHVGHFLDSSVKVIEGRGYEEDGSVGFNAFAIVSFEPAKGSYSMRSYAQGNVGDFVLAPTTDGYTWEIPAGPMTIRYTAVVKEGVWLKVGDRIMAGQDPIRFFEMNLKRVGDTDWPAAGAVPRK